MLRSFLQRSVNLVPWSLRSRIKDVPGLAPLQRWLVRRVIGAGEFEHTINAGPAAGLRLRLSLPREKGLWTGTYENHFVGAIAAAVPKAGVCFDVGGFRGFVSGVMALQGASRVICFEPLPGNAEAIRSLAALNPALPIHLRCEAVGASDGEASFDVMEDASMGKLESSAFEAGHRGQTRITVPVRSLDSLLSSGEVPRPGLIKLDVEGAELLALEGARNLLAEFHPIVFAEIHSPALLRDCESFLAECGYEVRRLEGSGASAAATVGVSHIHAVKRCV